MSFYFLDSSARSAWLAATTQQAQLEALAALWSGDVWAKFYSSAGTHLATVTYGTPTIDTGTTPRAMVLGAWSAEAHYNPGTATYCILQIPSGADILRADVSLAGAISDPGGRVRVDIGTRLRIYAAASLPADDIPSWVPTTAWEWTSIPDSTWDTYMVADGSGIVPDIRLSTGDPGPTWNYQAQWAFSGPTYSKARHEVYFFGGGHAATTSNPVVRWNLSSDSPSMTVVSAPTSIANRLDYLQNATHDTTAYHVDGKPASPHSYYNNHYLDAADEFISFGISNTATGYPTASGGTSGSGDVAGMSPAGVWRAEGYYSDVTRTLSSTNHRGPRMTSDDGTTIYYWDGNDGSDTADIRKWVQATDTHSTIGASVIPFYSKQSDDGSGTALVMGGADSSAGWQAKFVTLSSGSTVSVTVSGDSIPSGRVIFDLTWCGDRGYWLAMWVNSSAQFGGASVSAITIATITKTGADTAAASTRTMTGTGPTMARGWGGAFYDPALDAVIVVPDHSEPLKVFKVAA